MLLRHSQSGGVVFVVVVVVSSNSGAFRSGARGCVAIFLFCLNFKEGWRWRRGRESSVGRG